MNIANLHECLEPETDKYGRVIYRKAVLINDKRMHTFTTDSLIDFFEDTPVEILPPKFPQESAIQLSTDKSDCDCLKVFIEGEYKEILSKKSRGDARDVTNYYEQETPVEALYTQVNGYGIRAEFNRDNPSSDVKAVLEITQCLDADISTESIV